MAEQTAEEIEAETAALVARLEAINAKKKPKTTPKPITRQQRDGERLAEIQRDTRVKNATLKNSHGGYAGNTIIQRIEIQMDRRRKVMERLVVDGKRNGREHTLNTGRYEGMAGCLALLRSSSVIEEVSRSNERLGIE